MVTRREQWAAGALAVLSAAAYAASAIFATRHQDGRAALAHATAGAIAILAVVLILFNARPQKCRSRP